MKIMKKWLLKNKNLMIKIIEVFTFYNRFET